MERKKKRAVSKDVACSKKRERSPQSVVQKNKFNSQLCERLEKENVSIAGAPEQNKHLFVDGSHEPKPHTITKGSETKPSLKQFSSHILTDKTNIPTSCLYSNKTKRGTKGAVLTERVMKRNTPEKYQSFSNSVRSNTSQEFESKSSLQKEVAGIKRKRSPTQVLYKKCNKNPATVLEVQQNCNETDVYEFVVDEEEPKVKKNKGKPKRIKRDCRKQKRSFYEVTPKKKDRKAPCSRTAKLDSAKNIQQAKSSISSFSTNYTLPGNVLLSTKPQEVNQNSHITKGDTSKEKNPIHTPVKVVHPNSIATSLTMRSTQKSDTNTPSDISLSCLKATIAGKSFIESGEISTNERIIEKQQIQSASCTNRSMDSRKVDNLSNSNLHALESTPVLKRSTASSFIQNSTPQSATQITTSIQNNNISQVSRDLLSSLSPILRVGSVNRKLEVTPPEQQNISDVNITTNSFVDPGTQNVSKRASISCEDLNVSNCFGFDEVDSSNNKLISNGNHHSLTLFESTPVFGSTHNDDAPHPFRFPFTSTVRKKVHFPEPSSIRLQQLKRNVEEDNLNGEGHSHIFTLDEEKTDKVLVNQIEGPEDKIQSYFLEKELETQTDRSKEDTERAQDEDVAVKMKEKQMDSLSPVIYKDNGDIEALSEKRLIKSYESSSRKLRTRNACREGLGDHLYDEVDDAESGKKHKRKHKSHKDDKLERWAKEFNSMCETVDSFELCVE